MLYIVYSVTWQHQMYFMYVSVCVFAHTHSHAVNKQKLNDMWVFITFRAACFLNLNDMRACAQFGERLRLSVLPVSRLDYGRWRWGRWWRWLSSWCACVWQLVIKAIIFDMCLYSKNMLCLLSARSFTQLMVTDLNTVMNRLWQKVCIATIEGNTNFWNKNEMWNGKRLKCSTAKWVKLILVLVIDKMNEIKQTNAFGI